MQRSNSEKCRYCSVLYICLKTESGAKAERKKKMLAASKMHTKIGIAFLFLGYYWCSLVSIPMRTVGILQTSLGHLSEINLLRELQFRYIQ